MNIKFESGLTLFIIISLSMAWVLNIAQISWGKGHIVLKH